MRLPFHRFWRMALALAVLALALLHALGVHESDLLTLADQRLYDARLRLFMPATLDERVVIVDVDEASLAELGQWPWPRERMAELVEEVLRSQRASVIGFDAVFAEAGRGSEESDARFAAALQGRPAVLGYYLTSDRQGRRSGALPAPIAPLLAAQDT
ncbi:MAG: CHASE2 domain-containing protein, partial [Ottowia sp.]